MRNKTLFLIFMAMVVVGLLCAVSETMAFHAPIQGDDVSWDLDCTLSDYCTLTLEANDPIRGTVSQGYLIWTDYAYESNFNVSQDDGVIVWYYTIDEYPTNTYRWGINYAVYDPGRGEWKSGGPQAVSIEQDWPPLAVLDQNNGNNDGVVVWYYVSGESGYYTKEWRIDYAVYDPDSGEWKHLNHLISLYNGFLYPVQNNAGVVAWYYYTVSGSTKWYYDQTIYDPQTGAWESILPSSFDPAGGVVTLSITDDATVEYTYSGTTHIVGYNYEEGWRATRTKPFSYFVASPTSGDYDLFVWFTDMSIGATIWDWDFGDGGTSTQRSPYHTFTYSDVFTVEQTVSGPGGPDHSSTQQISVGPFYTLTVTKAGAGMGTVTSDPAGIDCGPTCEAAEAAFPENKVVTLTAEPDVNCVFTGWSGDCSGTECVITMNSNKTVTATVIRKQQVDFDGDGTTDIAVWRPSNGKWYIKDQSSTTYGASGDIPVPCDFDGDGVTDIAVWRPSNGKWYIKDQSSATWGASGDIPVPSDYDGDGTTDIAVWRPSTGNWFVQGESIVQWGASTDIPVPEDYDGDGATDIAVWRPSTGNWFVQGQSPVQWGASTDIPVPGDYDGDGAIDIAVWRPSNGKWYIKDQSSPSWGASGDIPVPGDYDGNGTTDIAVWRPSNGKWYIKDQSSPTWGGTGDIPLAWNIWILKTSGLIP